MLKTTDSHNNKNQASKQTLKNEAKHFIQHDVLPIIIKSFISEVTITEPGKKNEDYGDHNKTLNFPIPTIIASQTNIKTNNILTSGEERFNLWLQKGPKGVLPNGKTILPDGTASFGLVKDKEHVSDHTPYLQPGVNSNPIRVQFLQQLRTAILRHYKTRLNENIGRNQTETLRLNVVKGAMTLKHTDVLRSGIHIALVNF